MTLIDKPIEALGFGLDESLTQSTHWFERAKRVLAGGVSSSARASTTGELPYPQYIVRGAGSRIWDADDHQFIDLLLSYGSIPLGHCNPGVMDAVRLQLELGTMFGTCNTVEVELAEQICRMVPCAELVRFANSGSEAICGAVRAARGFTGRDKVLKFEGHYHGWVDVLAVSNRPSVAQAGPEDAPASIGHSQGIPQNVVDDVIIAPWNDRESVTAILDAHVDQFAAVILEPVVANNACTLPAEGFLNWLREQCTKRGIILIFDEIVTGFRLAAGGAQEVFDVLPDIAVYSKAIGGGFPISVFAGTCEVMTPIAQNTVKHGGTYNGNPVSAAAALQTLRTLAEPGVIPGMIAFGERLMEEARRSSCDFGVKCVVQGTGSMFQILFGIDRPTRNYRDLYALDAKRFAAFRHALLEEGVFANNSGLACFFTSAAHTAEDGDLAVEAVRTAFKAIA